MHAQIGRTLKNLSTTKKLLGAFSVVIALITVLAVFALTQQAALFEQVKGGRTDDLLPTAALADVQVSVAEAHIDTTEMSVAGHDQFAALKAAKDKAIAFADESIAKVLAGGIDDSTRTAMGVFTEKWNAYKRTLDGVETLANAQKFEEAVKVMTTTALDEYHAIAAPLAEANADLEQQSADGFAAATSTHDRARTLLFVMLAVIAGAALALGVYVARLIARPARSMVDVLNKVADGDLTARSAYESGDEIGQMSDALNRTMGTLQRVFSEIAQQGIGLSQASTSLSQLSNETTHNSMETSEQAQRVSAAAVQVSSSVQTIAAGTEEMTSTVAEVARSASQAAEIASGAVILAHDTSSVVARLDNSSAEIVNVVTVITNIAEQTNLLALNATIEAARAGEMGRGFAVVANEVKDLARETANATEQIRAMVTGIQGDTRSAVTSIEQISAVIDQINDTQTSIAGAVEQQAATTAEMSRTASDVARGATSIAENIGVVARAADANTQAASTSNGAAEELAAMADRLQQLVGQFRY